MAKKKKITGIETMTESEKQHFVYFASKRLNRIRIEGSAMNWTALALSPIAVVLAVLAKMHPAVAGTLIIGGFGGSCLFQSIANRIQMNKIIKEYSNGKLTYKDYKQLVKSGELAKMQELYRSRPEIDFVETESEVDLEGAPLSEKDIAELKVTDKTESTQIEQVDVDKNEQTTETVNTNDNGREN